MPQSKPDISVIIPCYNCEITLQESVDSVLKQNTEYKIEIILIDDFSQDNTLRLIKKIAKKHSNVQMDFHKENYGGGKTRNDCVKKANSDLIFCLDSDDILEENFIERILNLYFEEKPDGIGVHHSKKFIHPNIKNIEYQNEFSYLNERIPFSALFVEPEKNPLYSTFLFTKEAFEKCNGYPEHHGFDTQGFAFRFLANGLKAITCPDTIYHHRVLQHESYYLREHNAGNRNKNWFLIFEEFLHLFNKETQQKILSFSKTQNADLFHLITSEKEIYIPQLEKIIKKGGIEHLKKNSIYHYLQGNLALSNKDFKAAYASFIKALEEGLHEPIIFLKINSCFEKDSMSLGSDAFFGKINVFNTQDTTIQKEEGALNNCISKLKLKIKRNYFLNKKITPLYKKMKDDKKGSKRGSKKGSKKRSKR